MLAVDRLVEVGGELADLSAATLARLGTALPEAWSRGNPVDIVGDAPPGRYLRGGGGGGRGSGRRRGAGDELPDGDGLAGRGGARRSPGPARRGMIGGKPVLSAGSAARARGGGARILRARRGREL